MNFLQNFHFSFSIINLSVVGWTPLKYSIKKKKTKISILDKKEMEVHLWRNRLWIMLASLIKDLGELSSFPQITLQRNSRLVMLRELSELLKITE